MLHQENTDIRHYQEQVVIDFTKKEDFSETAYIVADEWNSHPLHEPCIMCSGTEFLEHPEKIAELIKNSKTRIYIIAHGGSEVPDVLQGAQYKLIHHKDVAIAFKTLVDLAPNVDINLFLCEGALGKKDTTYGSDSFAAKLHFLLAQLSGKDIHVTARNRDVIFSKLQSGKKTIRRGEEKTHADLKEKLESRIAPVTADERRSIVQKLLALEESKQPGTKIIFMLNSEGNQICVDGYDYKWKQKVLDFLKQAKAETPNKKINSLFTLWNETFPAKSSEDIYFVIRQELETVKTVLNDRSFLERMIKSDWKKGLENLLRERENIITSESLVTRETGNGSPFGKDKARETEEKPMSRPTSSIG